MKLSIKEIAQLLDGEVQGNENLIIDQVAKIQEGKEGSISFLSNLKYESHLYTTNASAVIVDKTFVPKQQISATLIRVEDAYSAFSTILEEVQRMSSLGKTGIEQPSFLHESVQHGEQLYLGAFAYVGANVQLGKNVKIYPQVYLGDNVQVGDNTILMSGVKVYSGTVIGSHCTIHAGTVIGSDGFGFAPQADGSYKKIPQIGNVIIEDHVEIGANSVIDCATTGSTVIERGVKLDNLIQIAHNVRIGENTVMAGQSGISGSSSVGKNCVLAGQVGIAGHVEIADRTVISAQSGVGKSLKKPGQIYGGSPVQNMSDYRKSVVLNRKLPELLERIELLEQKYQDLT
ncbi:UDP-3-O-(3-hydroxymyristoyl)glucosamine N-acyltransferase [Rapidithrix thailandica]|uniref:UDP-3-O-acylglucosamine N-acyltransferase n=1 Tax=Rapidithrix thailandica TaxID=413964 RepID=A0AAW9SBC1_9BACT